MNLLDQAQVLLALLMECHKALPEGELKSRVQAFLADQEGATGTIHAYNLPKR